MDLETLVEHYPSVYHMAEVGSWPGIRQHGLLSTSTLLDLFECDEETSESIEAHHRPEKVTIRHRDLGVAVVRDQKPMSVSALEKVLVDCGPEEWFRLLNRMVFFWPTMERLRSFLGAKAYRQSQQIVLTVDAKSLLERHGDRVRLSPINSGATLYAAVPRGPSTFQRLSEYPFSERKRKRGAANAIAEIAVQDAVRDIESITISVDLWVGPDWEANIWRATDE